jgi:hypothetical protein
MAQTIDDLLSQLHEINVRRILLNDAIYEKNRSWAVDLTDTYLKVIPKDIYNIIYKMNLPCWYFNAHDNDASIRVFPCINCDGRISCYMSIWNYIITACKYCSNTYVGKDIIHNKIFHHIMIKRITKYLNYFPEKNCVISAYFTNMCFNIQSCFILEDIDQHCIDYGFLIELEDNTVIHLCS